jgi:hypothetical protein
MSALAQVRDSKRSWLAAAIKDENLAAITAFCVVGLLVSLNVMLRIPDFGALISQLN